MSFVDERIRNILAL